MRAQEVRPEASCMFLKTCPVPDTSIHIHKQLCPSHMLSLKNEHGHARSFVPIRISDALTAFSTLPMILQVWRTRRTCTLSEVISMTAFVWAAVCPQRWQVQASIIV